MPSRHVLLQWCAWWAAGILSRFRVGTSGRTPYEVATGHRSKTPIACFGEHILYHKKRNIAGLNKAESEWYDGIYLGMSGSSSYILVGTPQGIERTTSFRRQPEGTQWSRKLVDSINTTLEQYVDPTDADPDRVVELPMPIPFARLPDPEGPPQQRYRRINLEQADSERFGWTPGCPA